MKCKFIENSLFFTLAFIFLSPNLGAQEWIQNIKNPKLPYIIQYSTQSLSSSEAERFSDKIEMDRASAKVVVPFSKSEEFKQSFSFDFNQTKIEQINESPTSPVPDKLTEEKFGYQFISKINDQKYYGMNTEIGSSSDEPFHNWSVTEVSLTPFYYYDKTPRSSWVFMLNYSNQRAILPHIPLPGFIYIRNNQKGFTLFAGIPVFGFFYKISDSLMMNYFTLLPWMHQFKVTYFVKYPIQIYAEFKMAPELFKSIDYVDNEDRIILRDQRAVLGTQFPVVDNLTLDIHGGVSFNREIYQAEDPSKSKDWLEEIEDQTFFNAELGIKF
ncbi:MAG: hypothetical protein V4596_10920 [Bdellovibrionota bacterium]